MENVTKGKIYFDLEEHSGKTVHVHCTVDTVSRAGIGAALKNLVADFCKMSKMDADVNGIEYTDEDMLEDLAVIFGLGFDRWKNNTVEYQRLEIAKTEVVNENH